MPISSPSSLEAGAGQHKRGSFLGAFGSGVQKVALRGSCARAGRLNVEARSRKLAMRGLNLAFRHGRCSPARQARRREYLARARRLRVVSQFEICGA